MSTTLPTKPLIDSSTTSDHERFDLVELLLNEQQQLTAVERFSALHDEEINDQSAEPEQARYYRSLLPATAPGPGQQYAFDVDLDSCSGCKACVVACHTLNGLEEDESWRSVGTVTLGGTASRVQHVTTACHHCEDPGCLAGCPVKAYEKDPQTGIVRHLDDQCIGCKYCTMMCPYEVPQYSERLGIVRKCDMCHQRLSVGEAPACVQSCPNEAISIRLVSTAERSFGDTERLAPGAPLSTITTPTTRYSSASIAAESTGATNHATGLKYPAGASAQDDSVDEVAESHWPLALMLVATQIAVGMLLIERLAALCFWASGSPMPTQVTRWNSLLALLIAGLGLNLAPLHLGKPLRAWRIFLGLKTSWLSREAVILGKFVGTLALATLLFWLPVMEDRVPASILSWIPDWAGNLMLVAAILLGIAGLASSAMIYIATRRTLWRASRTMIRFFGTSLVAGAAWSAVAMLLGHAPPVAAAFALLAALALSVVKIDWEIKTQLGPSRRQDDSYDRRSRKLIERELTVMKKLRIGGAAVGVALLALTMASILVLPGPIAAGLAITAAIAVTAGECWERLLYFSSVVYDRMPGILR